MARFLDSDAFAVPATELELLPFRFARTGPGTYLVSNMVGDFVRLSQSELERLATLRIDPGEELYARAYAAQLISRKGQRAQHQLMALRLRSRMAFLRTPTPLHIFVVTLRCEHSCPYCQVSRQSADRARFDMSEETAQRALRIVLGSPSPMIKVEFQGGEPLMNYPLIEQIVTAAKADAAEKDKRVEFVITSNLALLDDTILAFCKANDILISTSLDGPADLHNRNRPRPGGNSHELATKGIRRAQEVLGRDRVGALMTTTDASLARVEEIVDEYVGLGLDGIFLRPLSPYGFAVKTKLFQRYNTDRWLEFYARGLRVLHAITVKRLAETGRWIARNLPFVDHVALMGLENTGFAIANDRLLWVDPVDYRDELANAVVALASAGVRVSIYNLPLCLISESARPYAVSSISDWKQGYVEECDRCDEKSNCCGFFTSGRPRQSRSIRAIRGTKSSHAGSHVFDQAAPLA